MFAWRLIAVLIVAVAVTARPQYMERLPNGHAVWRDGKACALGHASCHQPTAELNPFGVAFREHAYQWTKHLCEMDADGDGYSNGQELGDPHCQWAPGKKVRTTAGISHPGDAASVPSYHPDL